MKFLNKKKKVVNVQIKLRSVYKESLILYTQFLNTINHMNPKEYLFLEINKFDLVLALVKTMNF